MARKRRVQIQCCESCGRDTIRDSGLCEECETEETSYDRYNGLGLEELMRLVIETGEPFFEDEV